VHYVQSISDHFCEPLKKILEKQFYQSTATTNAQTTEGIKTKVRELTEMLESERHKMSCTEST